jgi:hypothetical protein
LSPFLGKRMRAVKLMGKSVFVRELLPQDLKIEIERIFRAEPMSTARYLAAVVGKAHKRQMDAGTRGQWLKDLQRNRSNAPDALNCGRASSNFWQGMSAPIWRIAENTRYRRTPELMGASLFSYGCVRSRGAVVIFKTLNDYSAFVMENPDHPAHERNRLLKERREDDERLLPLRREARHLRPCLRRS